jgi:hypothetical protein
MQGSAYSGHYHAYLRDWLREGNHSDTPLSSSSTTGATANGRAGDSKVGTLRLMDGAWEEKTVGPEGT